MDFSKLDKIKIHFIIGPGRSGTTLLAMIFNNHKDCISAPEIKHFIYFYNKYRNVTTISQELINDLIKYFKIIDSSKNNNYFDTNCNNIIKDIKVGDNITYSQLTKFLYISLYQSKRDLDSISFIIDKNPFYTFHTEKIKTIFPDAKFVTILRDYRSYVLSNRQSQNPFISIKSLGYYCAAWNFHIDKLLEIKQKMNNEIFIIKYEDFVLNKEEQMQKVLNFLNIPYDNEAFKFNEKLKEKIANTKIPDKIHARAIKTNTDLMKPVNSDRVAAWKKEFSNSEIQCIETLSGSRGILFDYFPSTNPNIISRLYYKTISFPGYIRVFIFYLLNSPKIHHYLNEVRKAKFENKIRQ